MVQGLATLEVADLAREAAEDGEEARLLGTKFSEESTAVLEAPSSVAELVQRQQEAEE